MPPTVAKTTIGVHDSVPEADSAISTIDSRIGVAALSIMAPTVAKTTMYVGFPYVAKWSEPEWSEAECVYGVKCKWGKEGGEDADCFFQREDPT